MGQIICLKQLLKRIVGQVLLLIYDSQAKRLYLRQNLPHFYSCCSASIAPIQSVLVFQANTHTQDDMSNVTAKKYKASFSHAKNKAKIKFLLTSTYIPEYNKMIKSSTGTKNQRLWQMLLLIIFRHLKVYLGEKKEK